MWGRIVGHMTTPRPAGPDVLDVFHWNAHVGCTPGNLRKALDHTALERGKPRPHVIVLNEVPYLYAALRAWANECGYAHHQERPGNRRARVVEEAGTTAVLVDTTRQVGIVRRKVAVMRTPWMVFSHKRLHHGRRFERVWLATPGGRWKLCGSHWPTRGNVAAQAETVARTVAWFTRRRRTTVAVDVGDHNVSIGTMRALFRALGVRVAGRGVDHAAVAGGRVEGVELGKLGSDHHAWRYRVTRAESARRKR